MIDAQSLVTIKLEISSHMFALVLNSNIEHYPMSVSKLLGFNHCFVNEVLSSLCPRCVVPSSRSWCPIYQLSLSCSMKHLKIEITFETRCCRRNFSFASSRQLIKLLIPFTNHLVHHNHKLETKLNIDKTCFVWETYRDNSVNETVTHDTIATCHTQTCWFSVWNISIFVP